VNYKQVHSRSSAEKGRRVFIENLTSSHDNTINKTDVVNNDTGIKNNADTGDNPQTYRKRIGSTVYIVTVHFSEASKETVEDKLLRLIKREVENGV
jgi:multidrug efflux pump subunit AcrB